ncbi:MAG: hypothetical protein OEW41_08725 [Actinomycetota bacterium]|nr:hypothetical protein [Actinomycetota bacterium]
MDLFAVLFLVLLGMCLGRWLTTRRIRAESMAFARASVAAEVAAAAHAQQMVVIGDAALRGTTDHDHDRTGYDDDDVASALGVHRRSVRRNGLDGRRAGLPRSDRRPALDVGRPDGGQGVELAYEPLTDAGLDWMVAVDRVLRDDDRREPDCAS